MKRILILLLLISIAATGVLVAQENESNGLEPLMAPGDLAVSAGLGYGFFWGAIDVSGGVELILSRYDLGGELPLTFGRLAAPEAISCRSRARHRTEAIY